MLTTLSQNNTLHLTQKNEAAFHGDVCYGGNDMSEESWGRVISLGPLSYGQTRYVSVPMQNIPEGSVPYLEVVLEIGDVEHQQVYAALPPGKRNITALGTVREGTASVVAGHLTAKTVTVGLAAITKAEQNKGQSAVKMMHELTAEVVQAAATAGASESTDWADTVQSVWSMRHASPCDALVSQSQFANTSLYFNIRAVLDAYKDAAALLALTHDMVCSPHLLKVILRTLPWCSWHTRYLSSLTVMSISVVCRCFYRLPPHAWRL